MTNTIVLDEHVEFPEFSLHGHAFTVDPFDAVDKLAEIDEQFVEWLVEQPDGSKKFADAAHQTLWLEAIASHIRAYYGAKQCSRFAASQFYGYVTNLASELKKKATWTLDSPTGSGSMQGECPNVGSEPSLQICPDSMPSGSLPTATNEAGPTERSTTSS